MKACSLSLPCIVLALLLSACGVGTSATAPDLYVLKADIPQMECKTRKVVEILMPDADPSLEGSRIAVFDTPLHLNYYTGADWAAPLPRLMQGFLVDAFNQTRAFKNVSDGLDDMLPDFTVLVSIQGFEVRGITSPLMHVSLLTSIVNANSGKLIKVMPFEAMVSPEANHMPAIVNAFNDAMNDAAVKITGAVPGCKHRHAHDEN